MHDLRGWQRDALAAWVANGRRGIVAAATGTGKTRLAFEALQMVQLDRCRSIVTVPTRALQDQWLRQLRGANVVPSRRIGTIGGPSPNPSPESQVIVAVMDSARSGAPNLIKHWNTLGLPTMLVVDECHWAGSLHNKAVFDGDAHWRLGLSATPERGDDGFDDVLVPQLGGVVYSYPLRQAMDDGVLADLRSVNVLCQLSRMEVREYTELERRIELARREVARQRPDLFVDHDWMPSVVQAAKKDARAARLRALIDERRRMLSGSSGRLSALRQMFDAGALRRRRSIIFNETIDQSERVAQLAREAGAAVALDHSRLSVQERRTSLDQFRRGRSDCLVVVRTADEGIDVPDADQAVIVSGTMNARQRIQRLGRIVRLGGLLPRAFSLLAEGTVEERVIAGRDLELLGTRRVSTLRSDSVDWATLIRG